MMRKLFVALLVGAVAVGLAAPAFAADLKFTGAYRVRFQFDDNMPCFGVTPTLPAAGGFANFPTSDCTGNDFQTRFRPRFDVETEGGVRGVLRGEIGDVRFGRGSVGGGHGADGLNWETKWAYIDFSVPATPLRLRAGIQPFFLSKALFLDDDGSGLSLYGKLGEINANAWWTRANRTGTASGRFNDQLTAGIFSTATGKDVGAAGEDARDIYGLDLSFSPMKDLNLNVYLVYDHDMETAVLGDNTTGFWVGAAAAGKVQNIRWDLDFVYGSKETPHPAGVRCPTVGADPAVCGPFTFPVTKVDQKGWMVDGGIGMALAGTPLDLEVRGWWATGWDGSTSGDVDAFPILYGGSAGHEPGTQVWGGGGAIDIDATADNAQNTWGIGLIVGYTASPNLKITGNVHYIGVPEEGEVFVSPVGEGTLIGVDSVGTEVGVKIDYTIARGLVFTLTAGHLFLGDDLSANGITRYDDITKVAGVLNYGF